MAMSDTTTIVMTVNVKPNIIIRFIEHASLSLSLAPPEYPINSQNVFASNDYSLVLFVTKVSFVIASLLFARGISTSFIYEKS